MNGSYAHSAAHPPGGEDRLSRAPGLSQTKSAQNPFLEHAPIGMALLDAEGQIIDINSFACDLLSREREQLVATSFQELFPAASSQAIAGLLTRATNNSQYGSSGDVAYSPAAYTWQYFKLTCRPLDAQQYIVVLQETTGQRTAQEQLESFQLELEELVSIRTQELEAKNKELTQFAFIASHDLQEPLRTVRSYVDLFISEYQGQLDANADQFLSFIGQSTRRMSDLVKGLLDYSRIGINRRAARVDCNELLEDVLQDLNSCIQESGATIRAATLPAITGYEPELRALFQNLILNAIKFCPSERSPSIKVSASNDAGQWCFAVADNGIGIAPEHRDKIFVIYQRLHGRDEYGGHGVGLAQCRKIVELHNGRIWVDSEPGQGSTFFFSLQNQTGSISSAAETGA